MQTVQSLEETSPELAQMLMDICAGKLLAIVDDTRVWRSKEVGYYKGRMQHRRVEEILLPTPGRNDPCLCGSSKKFKKCCGTNA